MASETDANAACATYKIFGQTKLKRLEHMGWDVFCNEPTTFNGIVGYFIAAVMSGEYPGLVGPNRVELVFLFDSADSLRFALYLLGLKQQLNTPDAMYYTCLHSTISTGVFEEHLIRYTHAPVSVRLQTTNYSFFDRLSKSAQWTDEDKHIVGEYAGKAGLYIFPTLGQDFFTSCSAFVKTQDGRGKHDVLHQDIHLDATLPHYMRLLGVSCTKTAAAAARVTVPSTNGVLQMWLS